MEGIWYAHFSSGANQGDGLAVLRSGEVMGGDPRHIYTGSYQEDGACIYANVRVAPYNGSSQGSDLEHPISLFLRGSVKGDSALLSGHPNNRPDITVSVEMHKGA